MEESTTILKETIDKIAKENLFADYDVKIKPISSDGANYTSQLYLATISSGSRNLNLFAKVITLGDKIRSQGMTDMFKIEPFVYTVLSKVYRQLEEKHNVPKEHRLELPKFYGQNPTKGQEVIVLEDLSSQGYSVYDRFKSVSWSYAFKAIKELAKLHALSFAFEHEQPEEFSKALGTLKLKFENNEIMQEMMNKTLETALVVIEEKNRFKVLDFFAKTNMNSFIEYTEPSRRGVLMHGDFRMSNLMHKVDDDGVYQIKILDYQTMHIGSPVSDLLYFIFTGTDEEFRSKHYVPLLEHYYAQLSMAMRRLGLKPNEIYSREDFDYEMKQKLPQGLVIGVTLLPTILVEVEDAPIMDKDSDMTSFLTTKIGKLYPERLNGLINDFVKWRVL